MRVVFDPTTYSVTEGGSVNIMLTADSNFSVPFNVTLTSDSDEGRLAWVGVLVYIHTYVVITHTYVYIPTCTSVELR